MPDNKTSTDMATGVPFEPPSDFLTQIIPISIGMTISVMALIELADELRSKHVRLFLLPLCILTFVQIMIVLVALVLWLDEPHEFPLLKRCLIPVGVLRIFSHVLDAYLYVQRCRSILVLYKRIRLASIGFLLFRVTWIVGLQVYDLAKLIRSTSAVAQFLTYNVVSEIQKHTNFVAPMLQTVFVDLVLLYVIVRTLRSAGKDVFPSFKRLIRIGLLIFASCVFLLIELTTMRSAAMQSLMAAGAGSIIIPLSTFVNIDLFVLDVALFANPRGNAFINARELGNGGVYADDTFAVQSDSREDRDGA